MKKFTLLSIFSICICSVSFSQINKGSVLLGGGISGNTFKNNDGPTQTKNSWFSLAPSIGFAVKENRVIGINLSYSHNKYAYYSPPVKYRTTNGYVGGAFYRSYFPLAKKFYLLGEGNAFVKFSKQEDEQITDIKFTRKQTDVGINLYPGVVYAVSKRFHLEASINNLLNVSYSKTADKTVSPTLTSEMKGSGINFSANVSNASPLTIGFRFVLGK